MIAQATFLLLFAAHVTAKCPYGSTHDTYFNKCYQFVSTPKSFMDAEAYCVSLGGHLAEVQNAFENSYISAMGSGGGAQSFWIGANLLQKPTWSWTTGDPLNYTNWASGEPIYSKQSVYLSIANQVWYTANSRVQLPFVCNMSPNMTIPCNPIVPSFCPTGYYLHNANCMCYKYVKDANATFTQAKDACSQDGGMLATVPSQDVNDFLTALSGLGNSTNYEYPWIGLSCTSYNASSCTWVDGSPLGSYSNFYGAPNCPCVLYAAPTMTGSYDLGAWVSGDMYPRAYICQKGYLGFQ